MHFERQNAFQNAFFSIPEKMLPYLKFSDRLPETNLFFYLALPHFFLHLYRICGALG